MSNRLYNTLQITVMILLPAIGLIYVALGAILELERELEVLTTLLAICVALGCLLALSGTKYDGSIEVEEDDERKLFSLNLNVPPEELERKKKVIFKVNVIRGRPE